MTCSLRPPRGADKTDLSAACCLLRRLRPCAEIGFMQADRPGPFGKARLQPFLPRPDIDDNQSSKAIVSWASSADGADDACAISAKGSAASDMIATNATRRGGLKSLVTAVLRSRGILTIPVQGVICAIDQTAIQPD